MRPRRKVWLHRGLAALWVVLAIPGYLWWAQSIFFVILVSLYANFASEMAVAEAADDRQVIKRLDRIDERLDRLEALLRDKPVATDPQPKD